MSHRSDPDGESGQEPSSTHVYHLGEDESPSEAVVRGVAALKGVPALGLSPLYDSIDPEYLDGLSEGASEPTRSSYSLSFRFEGCEVIVTRDVISIHELDAALAE